MSPTSALRNSGWLCTCAIMNDMRFSKAYERLNKVISDGIGELAETLPV
jgi:hypothetical protein